jgi:hypothetical protein
MSRLIFCIKSSIDGFTSDGFASDCFASELMAHLMTKQGELQEIGGTGGIPGASQIFFLPVC